MGLDNQISSKGIYQLIMKIQPSVRDILMSSETHSKSSIYS